MKISYSNESSNIYQQKLQNASKSSQAQSATNTGQTAFAQDSVTISDEAYQMMSSGGGRTGGSPPMMEHDPSQALQGLVDDGTITEEQMSTISDAFQSQNTASGTTLGSNPLKSALDSLVSDGTLTEDQASSVAAAMQPPSPPPGGIFGSSREASNDLSYEQASSAVAL